MPANINHLAISVPATWQYRYDRAQLPHIQSAVDHNYTSPEEGNGHDQLIRTMHARTHKTALARSSVWAAALASVTIIFECGECCHRLLSNATGLDHGRVKDNFKSG